MINTYFQTKKKMMTLKLAEATGYPCVLYKSAGKNLKDNKIYGNSFQSTLPFPYQSVEYIENTNNEYINTDFIPNQDTKVETKIYLISSSTFFGARTTYNTNAFAMGTASNMKLSVTYGTEVFTTTDVLNLNTLYIAKLDKHNFYLNDVLLNTFTTQTFTPNVPMYLFAYNSNGSLAKSGAKRIYYTKIWDNDVLIRDMIPCYNIETNAIGMYDKVNKIFYANAGTGTFSKGNDISPTPTEPIEVLSLGETSRNLFNKNDLKDWYISSAGKITSLYPYRGAIIKVKPNTTYSYSNRNTTDFYDYYSFFEDVPVVNSTDINNTRYAIQRGSLNGTITTPAGANYMYYTNASNIDWGNFQIEEGNNHTDYKPYKYIDVVSSSNNFYNINEIVNIYGIAIDNNINGVDLSGYACSAHFDWEKYLKPNTTYTCFYNFMEENDAPLNFGSGRIAMSTNGANNILNVIARAPTKGIQRGVFTTPSNLSNAKYILMYGNNATTTVKFENIQIIEGNIPLVDMPEFEKYQEPITTTIDLTGHEPLRKIGDVADYIDYKNKKIIRNVGVKIFDGNESLYPSGAITESGYYPYIYIMSLDLGIPITTQDNIPVSCNYYKQTTIFNPMQGNKINTRKNSAGTSYHLYFSVEYNNLTTFKTFLSQQYANGTPVKLYYPLPTPIEENFGSPIIPTLKKTCILTSNDEEIEASNIYAKYVKK